METQIDFVKLNLQDALDLAIFVEEEAKERYEEFVDQIGSKHAGDASSFFKSMAEHEAKQARELKEKRKKYFGHAPSRVDQAMLDAIRDVEAPGYYMIRPFMSFKHALVVALASEVRGSRFYEKALEHVTNEEIKQFFSELRSEDLRQQNFIIDLIKKTPDSLSPEVDPEDVDVPELD